MNSSALVRIKKLRARLKDLDAERLVISVELEKLAGPKPVVSSREVVEKEPAQVTQQRDWHVFAGPARPLTRKKRARD